MGRLTAADIADDQLLMHTLDAWRRGDPISQSAQRFIARHTKEICKQRKREFERSYASRVTARNEAIVGLYELKYARLSYRRAGALIERDLTTYQSNFFESDKKAGSAPPGDAERCLYFTIVRSTGFVPTRAYISRIIATERRKPPKAAA